MQRYAGAGLKPQTKWPPGLYSVEIHQMVAGRNNFFEAPLNRQQGGNRAADHPCVPESWPRNGRGLFGRRRELSPYLGGRSRCEDRTRDGVSELSRPEHHSAVRALLGLRCIASGIWVSFA